MDIEQYGIRVWKVVFCFICFDEEFVMMEGDEVYVLLFYWLVKEVLFKLMGVEEVDFICYFCIFFFSLLEEGEFEVCEYCIGWQECYWVCYVIYFDFVLIWIIK